MAIRVELTADEEARLRERAARRGAPPEVLAGEMLRTLLHAKSGTAPEDLLPVVDEEGVFHRDRWERLMASIAAGTAGLPALPHEALTREALYSDHD